jgi:hypothetical protein
MQPPLFQRPTPQIYILDFMVESAKLEIETRPAKELRRMFGAFSHMGRQTRKFGGVSGVDPG